MIDAATGHVRWRVDDADSQLPADTGTDVFFVNGQPTSGKLTLVDVRPASGSVRWSVPAPGTFNGLAFGFGGYAVAFEDTSGALHPQGALVAFRLTTGRRAWTVKVPKLLQVPPVAVGPDLLLQPTDPSFGCPLDGDGSTVGTASAVGR